jgi:hypothetical protein
VALQRFLPFAFTHSHQLQSSIPGGQKPEDANPPAPRNPKGTFTHISISHQSPAQGEASAGVLDYRTGNHADNCLLDQLSMLIYKNSEEKTCGGIEVITIANAKSLADFGVTPLGSLQ